MSQAGINGKGSIGPSSITINGDVGTATGNTFNFLAKPNCGGSVLFTASTPNVNLSVTDGVHNTTIGLNSGISITTGSHNTALGQNTFIDLQSGESNVAFGDFSCFSIISGTGNCALGTVTLENLISGEYNIAIGTSSGANYAAGESSNILIGNIGVASENNVIRIGNQGSAPQEQNSCYIAGIVGVTVSNTELVTINSATGQLGVVAYPIPITAIQQVTVDGALVITPSGSPQNITITGNTVANSTYAKPVYINQTSSNSASVSVQVAAAIASTNIAKAGLSAFNSSFFTVDANGFVSANGSGLGETITGNSGGALHPTAGNWNIYGSSVAAGSTPVATSGSGSTLTVNVQTAQAIASTDATKIGLAAFNSADFTVDANGFVTANANIFPWIDQATGITLAINTGYFVTAATTQTLPASPAQGNVVKIVCDTAGSVVVTANTGQFIRSGTIISSSAGTFTNTNQGDTLELVYRAADTTWIALSTIGVWVKT